MSRRRMIYEGKAKILYEGPEPGTLIQYFKDDATAFNAEKKAVLDGKGVLNNRISEFLMTRLSAVGIPNHFIKRLNMREQLIKKVEIIPLEVIVRNVAAGTMSKRCRAPSSSSATRRMSSATRWFLKSTSRLLAGPASRRWTTSSRSPCGSTTSCAASSRLLAFA